MTIEQKRRELFEKFAAKEGLILSTDNSGIYWQDDTDSAWNAFNAALDAVEIVLPSPDEAMGVVLNYQFAIRQNVTGTTNWAANLGMQVVDDCRSAIQSTGLGIKVK